MFMGNYNFESFANSLENRFEGELGSDLWRKVVESPSRKSLHSLRDFGLAVQVRQTKTQLANPRVFISHRRADGAEAQQIAMAANRNNFDYWLDVLDPNLQLLGLNPGHPNLDILTAAIIEMALINCTHVIALFTTKTPGSMWVPYEYGRITDLPATYGRAAAFVEPQVSVLPEYLLLGHIARSMQKVEDWFTDERAVWV